MSALRATAESRAYTSDWAGTGGLNGDTCGFEHVVPKGTRKRRKPNPKQQAYADARKGIVGEALSSRF